MGQALGRELAIDVFCGILSRTRRERAVPARTRRSGEPCLAQTIFQGVQCLNVGLSDATAPALDPRAVVFNLHATEPSGFPQVLPGLLRMEGVEEEAAQRGSRPFSCLLPERPPSDGISVWSFPGR